ncbi:MAG: RNA polymerase sigma factor FliA [Pseudomonadota bacterium]
MSYDALAAYQRPTASVDALVQEHAPLVKRIAAHLRGRLPDTVLLDDLVQAGMIGLLEAARNFDAGQGASFPTFAGIRIRGAIIDEIRRGDWAPRSVHKASREISRVIAELEAKLKRDVSDAEVAEAMNLSISDYQNLLKDVADTKLFSLEALEFDDSATIPGSDDVTQARAERLQLRERVASAMSDLPERERLVLNLYYVELLNLKEIGAVLEVSESRVSQIMTQATLRLRARLVGGAE